MPWQSRLLSSVQPSVCPLQPAVMLLIREVMSIGFGPRYFWLRFSYHKWSTTEKRQNAESFNRQNTTCLCETDRRYVSLEQLCTRRKVEVLIHTRLKESIVKKLLRVLSALVVHF